jgi:hypothetical protein
MAKIEIICKSGKRYCLDLPFPYKIGENSSIFLTFKDTCPEIDIENNVSASDIVRVNRDGLVQLLFKVERFNYNKETKDVELMVSPPSFNVPLLIQL